MKKKINFGLIYFLDWANFLSDKGGTFKDSFREDLPYSLSRMLITVLPNSSSWLSKASKQTWPSFFPNDPVNSMEYVAISLREVVPQLSEQDAIAIMLEAHNTGVGVVIVCDLEPAEFYSESLKYKGISSSIEKED